MEKTLILPFPSSPAGTVVVASSLQLETRTVVGRGVHCVLCPDCCPRCSCCKQ
jgi:hypothetical protein